MSISSKSIRLRDKKKEVSTLFNGLFESGAYYHGYYDPNFFRCKDSYSSVTKVEVNQFNIVEGSIPSEVFDAYKRGLTLTDCKNTLMTSRYLTLLETWGEEKFNIIFDTASSTPLCLNGYDVVGSRRSIGLFTSFLRGQVVGFPDEETSPNHRNVKRGHDYFIKGIPLYNTKHYNGESQAFNVRCICEEPGNQRFIGFGLPEEGVTEDEIVQHLIDEYNQEQLGVQILPERFRGPLAMSERRAQKLKDHKIDRDTFYSLGGGDFLINSEILNTERVKIIADAPAGEVRSIVDGWLGELPPELLTTRRPPANCVQQ